MTQGHPSERPHGTTRWRIALFALACVLASAGTVALANTGAWAASGLTYALKDGNSAGSPTYTFGFGPAGAMLPIVGDWNGDGTDTVGLSLPSGNGRRFVETNYNAGSAASADFGWGNAGCRPISGDWNGDGKDSVGEVCRNDASSTWRWVLTNYNQASGSDADFTYGNVGCSPVVGDWDGNGTTTIGVACKNGTGVTWSLRNANSSGAANISFGWGSSACSDITGNWDGNLNNTTTVGQVCADGGTWDWKLSNHNSGGGVDASFSYGATLGLPITGDWNGDGITSIGVVGGWSIGTTPPPTTCGSTPGSGTEVTRWNNVDACVLGMLGLPASSTLINDIDIVIQGESGGDPNAINLTDINAQEGHPSTGLVQVIQPTFDTWHSALLPNNIWDPAANIYAGMNYGIHAYGSIPQIPGVASVNAGGSYLPY